MIHYCAMPMEVVAKNEDPSVYENMEIQWNGVTMLVQPCGTNEARIVRLISPDPYDYMNPAYAPGQVLRFLPETGKK